MIIVIEDEPVLRRSLVEFLAGSGETVEGFADGESALAYARRTPPDLAISDMQLPGMGGLELLAELAKIDAGVVRIAITAHPTTQSVVTAIRGGCYEYLEKPVDLPRLLRLVTRALQDRRAGLELAWHRRRGADDALQGIEGRSAAITALRQQIATLAGLTTHEPPPVLILGETGAGKGVVALALHRARFGENAPWIEVNCAALPASLVEAELFGFERSAFTDAKEAKPGLFEAATGGTIFLDEIGELPLEVQAKLLKTVESATVRRLGGLRDRRFSAAIVAATNVDLRAAIAAGRFREDLYQRLAAFTLSVPPLRDREGDAVRLAEHFLVQAAAKYRKPLRELSPEAERAIASWHWPGNVREMRFAVERAVILSPDLATALPPAGLVSGGAAAPPAAIPAADALPAGHASLFATPGKITVQLPPEGVAFSEIERAVLAEALRQTNGNVVRASRLLGLNRDALRYRIRKLGLSTDGNG